MSALLNMKRMQVAKPTQAAARQSVVARATTGKGKTVKGAPADEPELKNIDFLLTLPGVTAPFSGVFDPLRLSNTASVNDILRWRESELTHGRVAMLAALGFLVGENLEDFPAFLNFDGAVTGPAIRHFQQIEENRPLFWEVLVLIIGLAESYRVSVGWAAPVGNGFNNLKEDYVPGSLGFDPLGLAPEDDEEFKTLQTKELNNGRLAMIGIAGFVAQELVNDTEIFEHLFLRIEKEVILELDDIEKDLGLPVTALPSTLSGI